MLRRRGTGTIATPLRVRREHLSESSKSQQKAASGARLRLSACAPSILSEGLRARAVNGSEVA